jgi:hypothetical protein
MACHRRIVGVVAVPRLDAASAAASVLVPLQRVLCWEFLGRRAGALVWRDSVPTYRVADAMLLPAIDLLGKLKSSERPTLYALTRVSRLGPGDQLVEDFPEPEGILYLEQASFVTGVVLHIDGGQSAGT